MEAGRVVCSVAGHDRDRFYMVVRCEGDRIYIADGKVRKLDRPKGKNRLHLRPTNQSLNPEEVTTDRKLRQALAKWNNTTPAPNQEEGGKKLV